MTEIRTYRRKHPEAWLKAHPEQTWQCDILADDGSDHHGIGATEAEAIMMAALHYARSAKVAAPESPPPDDTIRDGDRHYAKDFLA